MTAALSSSKATASKLAKNRWVRAGAKIAVNIAAKQILGAVIADVDIGDGSSDNGDDGNQGQDDSNGGLEDVLEESVDQEP